MDNPITQQDNPDSVNMQRKTEVLLVDVLRPVYNHRKLILQGTALVFVAAFVIGGIYLYRQPRRHVVSIGFRPAFEGAADGKYPNGLPFAPTDIVAPSVVEQVYGDNDLQEFCGADTFTSALSVAESSPALQFLDAEFQSRLAEPRLTQIDRSQLMAEYQNRRSVLPFHYRLQFTESLECRVPPDLAVKALSDVLLTWASESDRKRGVANLRVGVYSPAVFDQVFETQNLLIRADLLRTTIARVIGNIQAVMALPGSELIRASSPPVSLQEVRVRLDDLLQAQLTPLVVQAGRHFGPDAIQWVNHALETSLIQLQAAEQRAEAFRQALREYSGQIAVPATQSALDRPNISSDVQAITPQIDRTFIEGIVEMSAANTTFRQELTRRTVDASVEAVTQRVVVERYRQLRETLGQPSGAAMAFEHVAARLNELTEQAKLATRQFNEIYSEFSRVALRPGPALYHIDAPAQTTVLRAFTTKDLSFLLLAVFLLTPILMGLGVLADHHFRRILRTMRHASAPPGR